MKFACLTAAVNLRAAKAGKPRRFSILAYSGGKLVVAGFPLPVVVDLKGAEYRPGFSILVDHQASVSTTLGQVDKVENDGRALILAGAVTGEGSPEVDRVLAMSDRGHQWEASIGAAINDADCRVLKAGESAFVNGQQQYGPFIHALRSLVRETTVLPMGADPTTSVNLAAAAAGLQGKTVTFEEWLASLGIDQSKLTEKGRQILQVEFDTAVPDGTGPGGQVDPAFTQNPNVSASGELLDLRASRAADHIRIGRIEQICGTNRELCAAAIRGGWTPQETELQMYRRHQQGGRVPRGHISSENAISPEAVLRASFCLHAGVRPDFMAKSVGQDVVNEAMSAKNRNATFKTLLDSVIRAAGMVPPSHGVTDGTIRMAFEASNKLKAAMYVGHDGLDGILSDSANKLLLDEFQSIPQTWQKFCVVGDVKDFKPATRYRLVTNGEYEVLPDSASFDSNILSVETYEMEKALTYGAYTNISRQMFINDDLGAFNTVMKSFGRLGAVKLEKEIYRKLLASIGVIFKVDNDNYLSGGGSVLGIAGLTAAAKLFDLRTDGNGDPCFITPQYLLVGPSNKVTAKGLLVTTTVVAVGEGASAAVTPDFNPHSGDYESVPTPWLENEGIAGHTATGWGLIAPPQGSAGLMEVGFLGGKRNPTVESAQMDFTTLGVQTRAYHDFAISMQDGRFGVWNAGV